MGAVVGLMSYQIPNKSVNPVLMCDNSSSLPVIRFYFSSNVPIGSDRLSDSDAILTHNQGFDSSDLNLITSNQLNH